MTAFGQEILVNTEDFTLKSVTAMGNYIIDELKWYSRLSILYYLVNAQNRPLTGILKKPHELPGGDIYLRGAHVMPLDEVAARYGNDPESFLARGMEIGGKPARYGDAALDLKPFNHIGMTIILWRGDDEFPARADLLMDSSCGTQLPPDIVWSTAMTAVLLFIPGSQPQHG